MNISNHSLHAAREVQCDPFQSPPKEKIFNRRRTELWMISSEAVEASSMHLVNKIRYQPGLPTRHGIKASLKKETSRH